VALGWVRWSPGDLTGGWLFAGLAVCALGDVLLLSRRAFDAGLVAFLLGHVLFIGGFRHEVPLAAWSSAALIPVALATAGAVLWLWPHLGRRRPAVTAYIVVISTMVWGGISAWWSHALPWTAAAGVSLFWVSDLAVARHRFVLPSFANRAVGLPLYYAGQCLIAFTIGS
jgi:uncharacterized membrane protein YhhN